MMKRYPNLMKCTFIATGVFSGVGWIYYQIKNTRDSLNNAVDMSILALEEPKSKTVYKENPQILHKELFKVSENKSKAPWYVWNPLVFFFAQRLVALSTSDNYKIRLKAVNQLAKIESLNNWHCSLLANMIDADTAVLLARIKGVNRRLFAEPPVRYLSYNNNMIVNEMKALLLSLHDKSKHPCLGYFISQVFKDVQDFGTDHDMVSVELTRFLQTDMGIIPLCLESLLHHCSFAPHAKDLAALNGLPLLTELCHRFKNNVAVTITLCRIIANLSTIPDLLEDLFKSGWIGILSEWLQHEDIRISLPAAQALANLEFRKETYNHHIYLLHPIFMDEKQPNVDVVFVHGLLGGVFFTWRQRKKQETSISLLGKNIQRIKESLSQVEIKNLNLRRQFQYNDPVAMEYLNKYEDAPPEEFHDFEIVYDDLPEVVLNTEGELKLTCSSSEYNKDELYTHCWPKDWLPENCSNLRVLGVNYDTTLSMWTPLCPNLTGKTNIDEQSNTLMASLLETGLGKRPIVWVAHSMGGILVKTILWKAKESRKREEYNLFSKTKGIIFYSTPHLGSSMATFNQASSLLLWPSIEVMDLSENSPFLKDVHKNFLKLLKTNPIKIISFVEGRKTVFTALKFNIQLVQRASGNPGVGEYYEIPLDHLGICKPAERHSFLYQKVVSLIREIQHNQTEFNPDQMSF